MLTLTERAPIYGWLAGLLVREIDEPVFAQLREDPLRELLARFDPSLESWLEGPWSEARAETLAEDFAWTFLLPGGARPFVSAWHPDAGEALGSRVAAIVGSALRALGREPAEVPPWGRLSADHVEEQIR